MASNWKNERFIQAEFVNLHPVMRVFTYSLIHWLKPTVQLRNQWTRPLYHLFRQETQLFSGEMIRRALKKYFSTVVSQHDGRSLSDPQSETLTGVRTEETEKCLKIVPTRAGLGERKCKCFVARHRKTRVTPLEVFLYKFHDCPVFFQLDMRQGYHQLLISPESGKVATWKLSDEAIHWILGKIPKNLNQHDDILLGEQDLQKQNSLAESCRFWYYINWREMPVLNWRNRFLWASFHEECIETKLRKDWGCEKK